MEKVNILIIGAGAVGLAAGYCLSRYYDDVVIVEKEQSFGRHTSSRNSEVIHSGIYYPHNSLKARLCLQGRKLLYDYLQQRNISYKKCGKLVVANGEEEIQNLLTLKRNGSANGVKGLEIYNKDQCAKIVPEVIAQKALFVPCTGIMDTHRYMQHLKIDFEKNDGFLLFDMEVNALKKQNNGYLVSFSNGEEFLCNWLVNCAGLECETIAKMTGIDTKKENLSIHYCKAEYFKTSQRFNLDKLIYPMPDPLGMYLGIHLTLNLAGEVRFGPSAFYVKDIDYSMDETNKTDFIKSVSKYLRFDSSKLHADDTGIRPKLQGPGQGFRDFYIREESKRRLPKFINLMGIESPGLTASLAIGEYVNEIVKNSI